MIVRATSIRKKFLGLYSCLVLVTVSACAPSAAQLRDQAHVDAINSCSSIKDRVALDSCIATRSYQLQTMYVQNEMLRRQQIANALNNAAIQQQQQQNSMTTTNCHFIGNMMQCNQF